MIGKLDYSRHKDRARKRQADIASIGRDIGEIPKVSNPQRRGRCKKSLRLFLKTYFPGVFNLPWSPNHLHVISKLEQAIMEGGLFAMAMPRGSGKTWICAEASLWAILYGYRRYIIFVSATDKMAISNMSKVKLQMETNATLISDFPEVCHPVNKIDRIANRCKGQTYKGKHTYIEWSDDKLVMPNIEGSLCSGSVFESVSITSSNIRGKSQGTVLGEALRPDFCVIDDPQDKESARSPEQCKTRLEIISGDILRMSGPGKKMTAVMPCTVIEKGDLCDQVLDREKHPEWNGERLKLLDEFPKNIDLWDQYRAIWVESQRQHSGSIEDATEFYRQHQKEMDDGSACTWPERYEKGEISGIQYAMNIYISNRRVFYSEFQNDPEEENDEAEQLNRDLILDKINGIERGILPLNTTSLTMYVDIHDKLLYWAISGYEQGFTGAVIDYGTWPQQKASEFTMDEARYTLESEYPNMGRSARIYQGLTDLTVFCLSQEYKREDRAIIKISRCHIDANWGPETPVVYRFCRQSQFSNILTPCHGRGIMANQKPISIRKQGKGEKPGLEWYISSNTRKRAVRFCAYDTNWWKSFVSQRLKTAQGDIGCLSINGTKPQFIELLASHLCAEYFTPTAGQGRRVDVWQQRAHRPDNHLFDCVVGCAVAASVDGINLEEIGNLTPRKERKKIILPAYNPGI